MSGVETDFRCHYDAVGRGLPILCLAGFGCSNWIFADLAEGLADKAQSIMPDARGMGRSPRAEAPYSIAGLAADGLALMDRLGIERFAVMGISMGGFVAQSLCLSAPKRVRALLLLCSSGAGSGYVPLPELDERELAQWYNEDPEKIARANTRATTHPSFERDNPTAFEAVVRAKRMHRAPLDQLLLQQKAVLEFVREPMPLEHIDCPSLVLSGAADRFVAPENSRLLARQLPRARLCLFPESDHLFFLEKPGPVTAAILDFLEGL